MTETTMDPKIASALVEAQRSANAVEKLNTNEHHKYKYASAESMILEARAALGAAGLALLTLGWGFASGAAGEAIGRVEVVYRLLHASGAFYDWSASTFVVPGKGRPVDKAESGAITENLSYTLRGLLLLPRVDEGASVETRQDDDSPPQQERGGSTAKADATPAWREMRDRVMAATDEEVLVDAVERLDGAGLSPALELDVLAEIACRAFALAPDRVTLEKWIPSIKDWKLAGEPKQRAVDAFARAQERLRA